MDNGTNLESKRTLASLTPPLLWSAIKKFFSMEEAPAPAPDSESPKKFFYEGDTNVPPQTRGIHYPFHDEEPMVPLSTQGIHFLLMEKMPTDPPDVAFFIISAKASWTAPPLLGAILCTVLR